MGRMQAASGNTQRSAMKRQRRMVEKSWKIKANEEI
jgi:hypothetical protein